MSRRLIQIVPVRSTSPEGVGDYSRLIAGQMLADHDVRTTFISGTPLPPDQRRIDEWTTLELPKRSKAALLHALDSAGADRNTPILLHLSGYGYHPKGVPFWLASALETWRRANPQTPLVTVFHELFATGPVWRSAFWAGFLQAHIARRMQAISTAGLATTDLYAGLLDRWNRGDAPMIAMPVFSTIGEAPPGAVASQRSRSVAIFGRPGVFEPLYQNGRPTLEALVEALQIDEIVDIGARPLTPPPMIGRARVRVLGQLPPDLLLQELVQARFGLIDYDADRLAKSSIFGAYCAQGVIPIVASAQSGVADGLYPSRNYLRTTGPGDIPAPMSDVDLDALQDAAIRWYDGHSLKATVDLLAALMTLRNAVADPS